MKFCQLKNRLWSSEKKIYPSANIEKFDDAEFFFGNGEIDFPSQIDYFKIYNSAPLFDYFILWDFSEKKENDWILLDTYAFLGKNMPTIRGYLVSKGFKSILESFSIASPSKFYASKLMYHNEKLDYYIFQMAWNEWEEFDFDNSSYYEKIGDNWQKMDFKVSNSRDFRQIYKLWKDDSARYKMCIVLKRKYDIFYIQFLGFVISEDLRKEIERIGITGIDLNDFQNIEFTFLENA